MAIFMRALLLAAVVLGAGIAHAQKLPLQLELQNFQKVRTNAPVPLDGELTWNGPGTLKGRLAVTVRESSNVLASVVGDTQVLTNGKNFVRLMIPTVESQSSSDNIELHVRFILDEDKGEVDLGVRPVRISLSTERVFRVAFCDQFSFKLDPDIQAALQSFRLERYWRPVGFDSSRLAIAGINRTSRNTPAQRDPSEKLLRSIIGELADSVTLVDSYEPPDMPVDPHWYCSFNIVLISQSGFARMRGQQLDALAEWVRAGGSLLVEPLGVLEDRHLGFLNQLANARPEGPFTMGVEGRIELPDTMFETFHAGLGQVAVLHKALDGKQNPDSRPWKEMVAFLWKLRSFQRDSVRTAGHFRLGDPRLTQNGVVTSSRPRLPSNFKQLNPQQQMQARRRYDERMAQYQYQLQVQAQRQRMIAQQQFARMQGLNINSVAMSGGVGDLEFHPIQSGDGFLQRLIPDEVEIVPLEYIAGILILYILAIGPGEYFLLGLFRLRRFTWITFPLLTVGFTLFTVWLSNDYLSSSVERTHTIVIDVGEDGTALRENRFELLYTASTHDVITDVDRGLFTPIEHSRFSQGSIDNGYGVQIPPGAMYRGNMPPGGIRGEQSPNVLSLGPPSIEGKPPGIHKAVQNVPQWTPQINRIFRINPDDEQIAEQLGKFDWTRDWDLRRDGRELSQQAIKAFGPQTKVIGFVGREVLLGDPGEFFVQASSMDQMDEMGIGMQMEMPHTRDFLTDICVRIPGKLFEVVSQIAPHGGDNFEDITLLDVTDDSQSLLVIVVPDENGLRIYRRLYRNGVTRPAETEGVPARAAAPMPGNSPFVPSF